LRVVADRQVSSAFAQDDGFHEAVGLGLARVLDVALAAGG
jgi:hypothetical protein